MGISILPTLETDEGVLSMKSTISTKQLGFAVKHGRVPVLLPVVLLSCLLACFSCASPFSVARLDSDADLDLSGSWNDTDIRLATTALVDDCLASGWITQAKMRLQHNPVVIVGTILNHSSEHIDTAVISKRLEMALVNTGRIDMVADMAFRDAIREERQEQQYFASEDSAKRLGKELGADYLLQGSVRTNLDQVGGTSVRTYYISAELIDIETNKKVWVGEETIRKLIKQSKYTW